MSQQKRIPNDEPEVYEDIGIRPPKGVILYGVPGTGKTLLAKVDRGYFEAVRQLKLARPRTPEMRFLFRNTLLLFEYCVFFTEDGFVYPLQKNAQSLPSPEERPPGKCSCGFCDFWAVLRFLGRLELLDGF